MSFNLIDISFAQGGADWDAIEAEYHAGNIGGVIIRAGYGSASGLQKDDQFDRNQSEARNRRIPRQFYAFAYPGRSAGKVQAQGLAHIVGQLQLGESVSLDMEDEPTYGRRLISSDVGWALEFLRTARDLLGPKPLLYINTDVKSRFNWSPIKDEDFGLWQANYGANDGKPHSEPDPAPWDFNAMWQFTSRGKVAGISPVDVSRFNGDASAFLRYGLQGSAPAPAPAPAPPPVPQPSTTYPVHGSQPGYYTADDAANSRNSNSKVPEGIYAIFNTSKGMINITRQPGAPGWWINPAENGQPSGPPSGQIYTVARGDTIDKICGTFGISKSNNYAAYRAMNPNGGHGGDWTNIWPGDKVRVS